MYSHAKTMSHNTEGFKFVLLLLLLQLLLILIIIIIIIITIISASQKLFFYGSLWEDISEKLAKCNNSLQKSKGETQKFSFIAKDPCSHSSDHPRQPLSCQDVQK